MPPVPLYCSNFSETRNFARCKIHFASKTCVLLYCQHYCTALKQRPSAKLCIVVHGIELRNFYRGHHLYSAGRPSRWALAHILVTTILGPLCVHYICVWFTPIMIVCIIWLGDSGGMVQFRVYIYVTSHNVLQNNPRTSAVLKNN